MRSSSMASYRQREEWTGKGNKKTFAGIGNFWDPDCGDFTGGYGCQNYLNCAICKGEICISKID